MAHTFCSGHMDYLRTQRNEKSKTLVNLRMAARAAMIELKVAYDMTGDENLGLAAEELEAAIDTSYPKEMQDIRRGWKEAEAVKSEPTLHLVV